MFDAFTGQAADSAAASQAAGLNAGYDQASGLIGQGNNALTTNYAAALSPYTTNFAGANAGQTQLANLLGLNGAKGNRSALNTLNNMPGYQFALQQGAQNVDRNAAATGGLQSGGLDTALQAQGQGLAQQNYTNYVNQLMPYLGAANSAAGGIAGVNTGLGQGLNQNYNNQAGLAYGTQTGIGNANANATLGTAAGEAGLLNAGLSLGGAALGLGGASGLGGTLGTAAGSGLSNIFRGFNSGGAVA